MAQLRNLCKKIILIIVLISLLISFCAIPSAYAKLDLEDGEFYYAGTQRGQYTVSDGIFEWLLSCIGDIADWLLGIITMGFRMVFVGWTALLEKLLTWALESTSGVNVDGDIIDSNTDLTSITDSTNNVTIEAIVYNHVAALDANMFDYERTIDDLKYSGTGHLLKCERDECNADENSDVTSCCGTDGTCSCECKGKCEGCRMYIAAVKEFNENQSQDGKDPIIIQIKKTVAMWYYIIRTLALAAMLIILIVVGIKMAISTAADQKASYKKMLVDWLVGMIIIFTMHYILLFAIYINEILVNMIEDTAHSINEVQMRQLAEQDSQDGVKYSDAEIEQKVYEAVRTRAYDAKLINGLSGMIMYMTLVYFAFRYTIVYVKRLFTIIVLTIMSPAVGVGYAFQKALTGKQMALKTWLTEYILNTIIQTVHALIYAIFISQALVLSLESIAGVIVALILMNYTLKADALFRKIFRISTGMVEDTQNSAENLKKNLSSAYVGGKSAINTLTNTPYTNALKGVGKAALAAPLLGVAGAKAGVKAISNSRNNRIENKKESSRKDDSEENGGAQGEASDSSNGSGSQSGGSGSSGSTGSSKGGKTGGAKPKSSKFKTRTDDELLLAGKVELKKNFDAAEKELRNAKTEKEQEKAMEKYIVASDEYNRFQKLTVPTNLDIAVAHGKRLISVENNFVLGGQFSIKENLANIYHGIYGNTYKDPITGKKVNDGSGYYNQFRPEKLFGLTDKDKKLLAKQFKLSASPIIGFASLMMGMATFVAHPKAGFALLGSGASMINKGLGRNTGVKSYKGKYTNARFSISAMKNMSNIAIKNAQKEYNDMMIEGVKTKHPKLYKGLKIGTVGACTLSIVSGNIVPATILGAGLAVKKFTAHTKIGEGFDELDLHFAKQEKEQEKEFRKETRQIIKADLLSMLDQKLEEENEEVVKDQEEYKKDLFSSLGYVYDSATGNLVNKKANKTEDDKFKEDFENKLDEKMKNNSIDENIIEKNISSDSKLTDADVNYINKEIDNIISDMASGEKLDFRSEAVLDEAMSKLTNKLVVQGIIDDKQTADVVFKKGKNGLKATIKQKAELSNIKVEIAEQALAEMSQKDQKLIKEIVQENKKNNNISDYNQIDAVSVVEKLNQAKIVAQANNKNKPAVLTNEEKAAYSKKVAKYLAGLELGKKVEKDSDYIRRKNARKKVESQTKRRKKKLKQILEMTFDTDIDNPTDNIINQVQEKKKTGGVIVDNKGNTVEITTEESNRVLEMLFIRKELESLNTYDMTTSELKKGSYNYNKATKAKTNAAMEYYKQDLEIKRYALENSQIYGDKDYINKTGVYSQEEIDKRKEIEKLEKLLPQLKKNLEKAEREVKMTGPIVDLNETRKQILNRK